MVRLIAVVVVLLVPFTGFSQEKRTWVYVSRAGQDLVGSRFETALKDEPSRSTRYRPRYSKVAKTKFEFHIDLSTVDVSDTKAEQGKKSVVSIVIEEFGLPDLPNGPTLGP
jgi:hypothetical protein